MIRFLLIVALLACLGIAAAWIADHPGEVTLYWLDYRIDTSVGFLMAVVALLILLSLWSWALLRSLWLTPTRRRQRKQLRCYEQGLRELTYSVAALASADGKGALTHTDKAEKLLGKTPITLMLRAQIAKSQGDHATTDTLLTQLLAFKETEYLAARSLSDDAQSKKNLDQALVLAKRAYEVGPHDHHSVTALLSLHLRNQEWQQALQLVRHAPASAYATRSDRQRHRALVHLAYAKALLGEGRVEMALDQAKHALPLAGYDVPTSLVAAQAAHAAGQAPKAAQWLLKCWHTHRHPQLIVAMRSVITEMPVGKQRRLLAPMLDHKNPAQGSFWLCQSCGHTQPEWALHCPQCQAFDTLHWR